jgi:hypothetical protein
MREKTGGERWTTYQEMGLFFGFFPFPFICLVWFEMWNFFFPTSEWVGGCLLDLCLD